jgi:hypothetical protein
MKHKKDQKDEHNEESNQGNPNENISNSHSNVNEKNITNDHHGKAVETDIIEKIEINDNNSNI